MRKNTARHWLHAALDLLPVILIPVFMIYSHRHVLTERTEVDIQYKYQSNEVNSLDDLVEGNLYYLDNDFYTYLGDGYIFTINVVKCSGFEINSLDIDNIYFGNTTTIDYLKINLSDEFIEIGNSYILSNFVYGNLELSIYNPYFFISDGSLNNFKTYVQDYELLSSIHISDFNVIESVDVQDTNSSIMNVFMDDFNYSVNKYFNMGNVFNLKDVYHWFEVNIFNNNPPLVMASIYNIIVYEFVMDLLFLLYGLFMWFIDMCKALIEKPINSIK